VRCALAQLACASVGAWAAKPAGERGSIDPGGCRSGHEVTAETGQVTLFLCGDVMTGRGIDQILPTPSSPEIYESYLTSAAQYVEVAERVSGPIPRSVDFRYVWGDALPLLQAAEPAARIANLETAVTTSDEHWPGKGINYRMHPANVPVLTAAGIDACALANNHVLDWGHDGLTDTLEALQKAGIGTAGAGADAAGVFAPAVIDLDCGRRVLLFALGHVSSGIPGAWAAAPGRPGVWLLEDLSAAAVDRLAERVRAGKRPGDIAVASIHWGGNWGYDVPEEFRRFAHRLLDDAGIDLVHGHSSHHPLGMEVYRGRLILYGCGDFINDYEGIRGHEAFRGDLRVMYLPRIESATGRLTQMTLHLLQSHRFRLRRAGDGDLDWMQAVLDRESRRLGGTRVVREGAALQLRWERQSATGVSG